jgi:hypothetical protein
MNMCGFCSTTDLGKRDFYFSCKNYSSNVYTSFCKSCRSSPKEHIKIGFANFGFFYDFIWILQATAKKHKGVKIHFANRPLERFKVSQIYPWFAQTTLERARASQCNPRGLGATRLGEIPMTSPAGSAREWLGRL